MSIPIRLAADIGGTFTDVVLESEAGFQSTKVLTTLNQPEIGVMHGIKLLAYRTVAGGFLSERWLGQEEPSLSGIHDWSKMKYKRFIDQTGGWEKFQQILRVLDAIARKNEVSITNVATRWVLDQPAVGAVIIGARLTESEHRADNANLFSFTLDQDDHQTIDQVISDTPRIKGDCGSEYRQPPYCLLYTSPSPRDATLSRMPSSA